MDKRPLIAEDIALGKALQWDIYDAKSNLLLRRGNIIASQRQLEIMIERGAFVDATEYARYTTSRHNSEVLLSTSSQEAKELRSSVRLLDQASRQLEQIFAEMPEQYGGISIPTTLRGVADKTIEAIAINPDIALAYILFNQKAKNYATRHSLASAIVAVLMGQAMQKPDDEIISTACAALSMNVSLWPLQEVLQSRESGPTEEEAEAIQQHPTQSVEMLKQAGVTDEAWLTYVRDHHENVDGSGYPKGKVGEDIPENAKLISLADRYTALLAPRTYRAAILPSEALRNMLMERGKGVDPIMAALFIRMLGIYPPGAFVKLDNGEIAVVTKRTKNATTPVVHSLLAPRGYALPYPHRRETDNQRYAIREPVRPDWANIPFTMQQIWGKEASE